MISETLRILRMMPAHIEPNPKASAVYEYACAVWVTRLSYGASRSQLLPSFP